MFERPIPWTWRLLAAARQRNTCNRKSTLIVDVEQSQQIIVPDTTTFHYINQSPHPERLNYEHPISQQYHGNRVPHPPRLSGKRGTAD